MVFWERFREISSFYLRCTKPVCERHGLTQMEFDILMFFRNYPQYDTAADLVRVRMLTKSHVSSSLQSLKERGLIAASRHGGNRKTVHLTLTPAAAAITSEGKEAQAKFRECLFRDFTQEEGELFQSMFFRICDHARGGMEKD